MAINRPCPKCQQPLEIPQPVPEQIRCQHCGAVFKSKKKETPVEEVTAKLVPDVALQTPAAPTPAGEAAKAAPSGGVAADQWYYTRQGKRCGPCSLADLKQVIDEGRLSSQDMVLQAGFPKWRAVDTVPELAPARPAGEGDDFVVATPITRLEAAPTEPVIPTVLPAEVVPVIATAPPIQAVAASPAAPFSPISVGSASDIAKGPPPSAPVPLNLAVDDSKIVSASQPRRPGRFLSWLHSALPKPVLFGLYGAVGGLLGVLLLGELIWGLIHPKPTVVEPLKIAVAPSLTVYPGSQNVLAVKIARHGFEGPVNLEVVNPPSDLKIPNVEIAADKEEGEFNITAVDEAAPKTHEIQVRATAAKADKVQVSQKVNIAVEKTPPTLDASVSEVVTLYAGYANTIAFQIVPQRFEGAVRLQILNLPKGVPIPPPVIVEQGTKGGNINITAAKDAEIGIHELKLRAESVADEKITKVASFILRIEPPPGKLRINVSPQVTVFGGDKNTLTVLIERNDFTEDVEVKAEGLPRGVEIAPVIIKKNEKKAVLVVNAGEVDPKLDFSFEGRLIAKAQTVEDISEVRKFQLDIKPHPGKLRMTVSPQVTVFAGDKNTFTVRIARGGFDAAVMVEATNVPEGIKIPSILIAPNQTEGVMIVEADKLAPKTQFNKEIAFLAKAKTTENITYPGTLQLKVEPHPGKLHMTVSPLVTVFPGDENTFTVRIARGDFDAAVEVAVEDLPAGVKIPSVIIPAKEVQADLKVDAKLLDKNKEINQKLRVVAKAKTTEDITDSQPLQLRIAPPPPTLQLSVPAEIKVFPGGEARFSVKVERNRFKGRVQVDWQPQTKNTGLIALPSITIPADKSEGEMKVSADLEAYFRLGAASLPWRASARGLDEPVTSPAANSLVKIQIPPSDLQLTVSEKVEIHQGGKCQFTIKVARGGFRGPVEVRFTGIPDGVTIPEALPGEKVPPIILQDNENEKVIDGRALIRSPVGEHKIKAQASALAVAPDGKAPKADKDFILNVKRLDPSKRPPPLDVVFVLDVTDSMDKQIVGVSKGVQQFIKGLTDNEMEARVGLLAFRDINYAKHIDFQPLKFKGGKENFTTDFKEFSAEVDKLKAEGGGDEPESSLDAVKMAAEYPFDTKANRVLILITDATYQTTGNSVTMEKTLKALQTGKIDQVHLIVKAAHLNAWATKTEKKNLPGYQELHKGTKGKGSFFDFDKATTEGFKELLPLLSDKIASTIKAAEPGKPAAKPVDPPMPIKAPDPKPLDTAKPPAETAPVPPAPEKAQAATPPGKAPEPTKTPAPDQPKKLDPPKDPEAPKGGPVVSPPPQNPQPPVAARASPPPANVPTLQGVQSTEVYADKDRLQLLIAIALWTVALAGGIALALVAAQKLYLQQTWPGWRDTRVALLAGLVAGLLGGVIGQWFFQATSGIGHFADVISRVLAWTILGGLLGGGVGYFVPNMNLRKAFLGGCIGGCIGALGFALFSMFAHAFLGRLIGAILVGFFIGLMIALAEVAFRRYWLEIIFGEREIRTVTLGAATVALGGDEKLASVYIAGAPAKAFAFRVDRNRVYCEDFAANKTAEVSPGDLRHLGNVKIKVCSAATVQPTGANLQLTVVRDLPLMEGMPLTAEDIPGLEPQGADGIVALVSRRPNDPKVFLLRNRSKQPWSITEPNGQQRKVDPGLSIELGSPCQIDFGQVKATLGPSQLGN